MDADLVLAPGFEADFHQRHAAAGFTHAVVRDRELGIGGFRARRGRLVPDAIAGALWGRGTCGSGHTLDSTIFTLAQERLDGARSAAATIALRTERAEIH